MALPSIKSSIVRPVTPSTQILELDKDIRSRFERRTGSLVAFLQQWILLEPSQRLFFNARGLRGENYLHYLLSIKDLTIAQAVVQMCNEFARSTNSAGVVAFLKHIDLNGNDVWHYLAENLADREGDDALQIAQILIQLEIDFCRKNDQDQSPLAHLLIPEVKWASINAMIKVRRLSIEEIEESFSDTISQNEAVMAEIINSILLSDIRKNRGVLLTQLLDFALSPKAEKINRAPLLRAIFNYVGGVLAETVFMYAVESDLREIVDRMLRLLELGSEDATRQKAAVDSQTARQEKQVYIYNHLAKTNKSGTGILHRMVIADRANYIPKIFSLIQNENIWQINPNRGVKGQPERIPVILNRLSASPSNPVMSLLLMQDARGNTAYHLAVMGGREDCIRKLMVGLSVIDIAAIIGKIPNRLNLTLIDLMSVQRAHAKLSVDIKANKLSVEEAQNILAGVKKVDPRLVEYLAEYVKKAEDAVQRSPGAVPQPSFDLGKLQHIASL
ncbi:MAG: hypothetical protein QM523_01370 [Candidatus Pacebacteria bacterium]|nr:hypothetical protein [Candidatus Paceibacterota bacterium]